MNYENYVSRTLFPHSSETMRSKSFRFFQPSWSTETFSVYLSGEPLSIPYRIYHDPALIELTWLTARQLELLDCLLTRHHNGFIRERHLAGIEYGTSVEIIYGAVPDNSNYEWVPGSYESVVLDVDRENRRFRVRVRYDRGEYEDVWYQISGNSCPLGKHCRGNRSGRRTDCRQRIVDKSVLAIVRIRKTRNILTRGEKAKTLNRDIYYSSQL